MHLEQWIRKTIGASTIEEYRLAKLKDTIEYAYQNSSFYRTAYDNASIHPSDIASISDLSKFPLTEPASIAQSPYRFLCVSLSEIARPCVFVTTGTTGPQKKIFWSDGDIDKIIDFMAAGIGSVADPGDAVHIILPDGRPYSQADLLFRGTQKYGAIPIIGGMDLDAEAQLAIMEKNHSAVIFGYARCIFRMSNILDKSHELANLGVKALFLAGEYVATAMRNELSRIWNCRIYTHYGLTEMGLGVAVECAAGDGYHFNEADLLLELIDPATGESVPPGSEGELVFTTLTREAMPLIRYRTHDSSRMIIEPCSCGASMLQKFAHVRKRAELTSALQTGDEIYPALFDDCLFEIPGLIDYQAILIRENNKECFEFIIEMADCCADSISDIEKKLLSIPAVSRGISSGTMHPPRIELERKNSLLRTDRSKKLIIDHR